eukprot:scaffold134984_cov20-Tisochrysis_lutea.AAC.2
MGTFVQNWWSGLRRWRDDKRGGVEVRGNPGALRGKGVSKSVAYPGSDLLPRARKLSQVTLCNLDTIGVWSEVGGIGMAFQSRGVAALHALASERSGIEEALNDLKAKDNILPKIMSVNQQVTLASWQ